MAVPRFELGRWYRPDLSWMDGAATQRRLLVDHALDDAFAHDEREAIALLERDAPPGTPEQRDRDSTIRAVDDLLAALFDQFGPTLVADLRLRGRSAGAVRLVIGWSGAATIRAGNPGAGLHVDLPCDLLEAVRVVRPVDDPPDGVREPGCPSPPSSSASIALDEPDDD